MRKNFKKFLSVMMVTAMTAALCSSCGGGKSEKKAEKKTEATTQTQAEITSGGSVTVGITQDLDSLDPHKATAAGTKEILFNIFEGLVKVDGETEYRYRRKLYDGMIVEFEDNKIKVVK